MLKKTFTLLAGCTVVSVIAIAVLYHLSDDLTHQGNSFHRMFPPHSFQEEKVIPIPHEEPLYIAGLTPNTVYLAEFSSPFHVLEIPMQTAEVKDIHFKILKDSAGTFFRQFQVHIDSPHFYVTDGMMPAIFKGNLETTIANRHIKESVGFSKIVRLHDQSFAFRNINPTSGNSVLGMLIAQPASITMHHDLLKKQIDGQFCVDGMLTYDAQSHRLVYLYYYRNEFLVMDTTMQLQYTGHTIDTVSQAKLKIVQASNGQSQLGAPPLRVNRLSCAANGYLFVNSNLMGKDEKSSRFDAHAAIDIYDLADGSYRFSFYIPNPQLLDFNIVDQTMVALFDGEVRRLKLRSDYFLRGD